MRTVAIIPAAGSSTRIGGDVPKQLMKFNDRELIAYTLEVFQNSPLVDEIIVATSGTGHEIISEIRKRENLTKLTKIVEGGRKGRTLFTTRSKKLIWLSTTLPRFMTRQGRFYRRKCWQKQ